MKVGDMVQMLVAPFKVGVVEDSEGDLLMLRCPKPEGRVYVSLRDTTKVRPKTVMIE